MSDAEKELRLRLSGYTAQGHWQVRADCLFQILAELDRLRGLLEKCLKYIHSDDKESFELRMEIIHGPKELPVDKAGE